MAIGTQEHGTFPRLIDEAVLKAGRGEKARLQLVSYARASIREAQTEAVFDRDRTETQILATANPHIWTRPQCFRIMETIEYPLVPTFPHFQKPGRAQGRDTDYFYYAAANYFVFTQLEVADPINLSYFTYFQPLVYFAVADRPARYFADLAQWKYLDGNGDFVDTLGTTELDEAAQALVTNWLLFDWYDLVLEGTLAKIFKINGDQRAVSSFALFKSFIKDLLQGEGASSSLNQ